VNKDAWLAEVRARPRQFVSFAARLLAPADWIREAWNLGEVQDSIASDLVEEVRKWPPEAFLSDHDPLVGQLASALDAGQVAALFERFRERWPVCEPQLREEFAHFFGARAATLPLPLSFEEVVARMDGDERKTRQLMLHYADHPAVRTAGTQP